MADTRYSDGLGKEQQMCVCVWGGVEWQEGWLSALRSWILEMFLRRGGSYRSRWRVKLPTESIVGVCGSHVSQALVVNAILAM